MALSGVRQKPASLKETMLSKISHRRYKRCIPEELTYVGAVIEADVVFDPCGGLICWEECGARADEGVLCACR